MTEVWKGVQHSAEQHETPPSVEDVTRLFVASYAHSQGSSTTQHLIFNYLAHTRHGLVRFAGFDELKERASKQVHAFVSGPNHEDVPGEAIVETDVSQMLEGFQLALVNVRFKLDRDWLVTQITLDLLQLEEKYLVLLEGRPRARSQTRRPVPSPRSDPYFSSVCFYALAGNATGITEYDQLYRDIHHIIETRRDIWQSDGEKLHQIVNAYNQHHPQHRVALPPLPKM